MNILEKEIEDIIWYGIDKKPELLYKKGLTLNMDKLFIRQPDLGSYGRADILGLKIHPKQEGQRQIDITVLEIKKELINMAALGQACRYVTATKRALEARYSGVYFTDPHIVLVGKAVEDKGDFVYMLNELPNVAFFKYTIDFDHGFRFDLMHGYRQKDESLSPFKSLASSYKESYNGNRSLIIDDLPF